MESSLLERSEDIQALQTAGARRRAEGGIKVTTSLVNSVICNFWDRAGLFYKALSESWGCACRYHHRARRILQHRTTADQEIQLHLFHDGQEAIAGNLPSAWQHCRLRIRGQGIEEEICIEPGDIGPPARAIALAQAPVSHHRVVMPMRSAMRGGKASGHSEPKSIQSMTSTRGPKIAITLLPPEPQATRRLDHGDQKQIPNLCSSLASINALVAQCVGYLEGQETRY